MLRGSLRCYGSLMALPGALNERLGLQREQRAVASRERLRPLDYGAPQTLQLVLRQSPRLTTFSVLTPYWS